MKKDLSPVEVCYRRFNEDMRFGAYDVLINDLVQIKKHKESPEYGKICNKVMWRLISSAKRANISEKPWRRDGMIVLLTRSSDWLEIDNKNKRMAYAVLCKENIPFNPKLSEFLQKMNPNEQEPVKSKEEIVRDKFKELSEYFNSSEDMSVKPFWQKSKELIQLCGDVETNWKHIHFAPMYAMMQRRAQRIGTPVQVSLFDEKLQKADTIDKFLVAGTAKIYAEYLTEMRDVRHINGLLFHKYPSMLSAAVRKNSYKRSEVKELAKCLKAPRFTSLSVEKHLSELGSHLVDIYDVKQAKEIRKLHEWMWKSPKKQPLSKTAQTLVYVDMLYEKLVNDSDIGGEDLNRLYADKKAELMTETVALYGQERNGKSITKQEAQEIVINRRLEDATALFEPVNLMIDKKCRETSFYGTIIHEVKRRGIKYVYHAPVLRRRDNSFEI